MGYRAVAYAIVALHFAVLAYLIVGGYLALLWRWTIWTHLAIAAWAVAIVTAPDLLCPLTIAQNWARRGYGAPSLTGGFIDQYVKNVFYPARYETLTQAAVAMIVLVSWVLFHRTRGRGSVPATEM